jgi:hypothetical protein
VVEEFSGNRGLIFSKVNLKLSLEEALNINLIILPL